VTLDEFEPDEVSSKPLNNENLVDLKSLALISKGDAELIESKLAHPKSGGEIWLIDRRKYFVPNSGGNYPNDIEDSLRKCGLGAPA